MHTGLKSYKPIAPVFKITEIKKEFANYDDKTKNGDAATNGGVAKNTNWQIQTNQLNCSN